MSDTPGWLLVEPLTPQEIASIEGLKSSVRVIPDKAPRKAGKGAKIMSDTLAIEYVKLARKYDKLRAKVAKLEREPVTLAADTEARIKELESRVQALTTSIAQPRSARPAVDPSKLPGMPLTRPL